MRKSLGWTVPALLVTLAACGSSATPAASPTTAAGTATTVAASSAPTASTTAPASTTSATIICDHRRGDDRRAGHHDVDDRRGGDAGLRRVRHAHRGRRDRGGRVGRGPGQGLREARPPHEHLHLGRLPHPARPVRQHRLLPGPGGASTAVKAQLSAAAGATPVSGVGDAAVREGDGITAFKGTVVFGVYSSGFPGGGGAADAALLAALKIIETKI